MDAGEGKQRDLDLLELPDQLLGRPGNAKIPAGSSKGIIVDGVFAPIPLNTPPAHFSNEGRRKHIQGSCWISFVVDEHGMPQNERVVKALEPSMDEQALLSVSRYRFLPAMKDGTPVQVPLSIEVKFRAW
jgi:TonB family protein